MPSKRYKIGIIGIGIVGGAHQRYFQSVGIRPFIYDKYKNLSSEEEVNRADVVFVAVPTPFDIKKGCDLFYVENAIKILKKPKIIVIKSTIVPGSTEYLQKKYCRHKILFNPEFLVARTADKDMRSPDRQIMGYTRRSHKIARNILKILPRAPFEKIIPATEAEAVKYFGNTFLSTKVIFANQMYDLCQALRIDYDAVKECAAADKRIGPSHLEIFHSGYRGYGGGCLPKDIKALIYLGDKLGASLRLHKAVEKLNSELMKKQRIKDNEKC